MDGADDASSDDKLAGLVEQVDNDRGSQGAAAMADELRDRTAETRAADESTADTED